LLNSPLSAAGSSENDQLARLAGWLYLLTFPTTGAWYGISGTLLLAGDVEAVAGGAAPRGAVVVQGSAVKRAGQCLKGGDHGRIKTENRKSERIGLRRWSSDFDAG
jgi:hypothetical protein